MNFYTFHFIYTYRLLTASHTVMCECVYLRKIRFNVVHALCKVVLGHAALGAVRVELLGALLHGMDAYTDGYVQRERVALFLYEFNLRQMQREACGVQCACKLATQFKHTLNITTVTHDKLRTLYRHCT